MTTRLFFPFTTPAPISPAFDSGWEDNNEAVRRLLNHVKGNSALADGSSIVYLSTQDGLDRQYISYPMNKGISFSAATVKLQIMAKESNAGDDATSRLGIRILSRDGGTVRQTLLSVAQYGPETEYITTNRNKTFADGDTVTGTYTTEDGDRLCVEIGHSDTVDAGTSISVTCNFGEVGTDLAENETATSGNGWIEFSNTITFQPEAIPQPYIYKQYIPKLSKEQKTQKRGRRTNPIFTAWKAIFVAAPEESDFTSILGDYQIVKTRRGLTKFFARRYSRLRELLPVPEIPTTIDPKQFYQKYQPLWSRKIKKESRRITPTPDYTLWENLLKLFRKEVKKPKPVIRRREPIIRPTKKYELWFNLINLLRRNIKPIPRVIVKRYPILRPNPKFDSWKAIFVAVLAVPLISYTYSFYQRYLATWNKERKSQVRGHPITPRFSTWSWNILNPEVISHLIGKAQQLLRLKPFQWTKPNPHKKSNVHKRTRDTEPLD